MHLIERDMLPRPPAVLSAAWKVEPWSKIPWARDATPLIWDDGDDEIVLSHAQVRTAYNARDTAVRTLHSSYVETRHDVRTLA